MCLISGDSIVGAAPSPKLSPRPGRRASGPARKSRQPRPKPLCLRVCFLRDRQSSTTTLLKSSVKCHKCVLPTCNTIQPSMAAADLQSQQRRVSNNTRGTWPDPAPRLRSPFCLSSRSLQQHARIRAQPAKKSRSQDRGSGSGLHPELCQYIPRCGTQTPRRVFYASVRAEDNFRPMVVARCLET